MCCLVHAGLLTAVTTCDTAADCQSAVRNCRCIPVWQSKVNSRSRCSIYKHALRLKQQEAYTQTNDHVGHSMMTHLKSAPPHHNPHGMVDSKVRATCKLKSHLQKGCDM